METDVEASTPTEAPNRAPVRVLLGVVAVAMVLQVALTDYGRDGVGAQVFWLVLGLWLLWLVWRGSAVARVLVAVTALIGTVVYAIATVRGGGSRDVLLALAFLAQAVPLLVPVMRRHVRASV